MKAYLIGQLVKMIVGMLTPELLKKFVDMILDFVEDFVLGTKSTLDDAIVLPVCNALREILNVPDDDDG